MNKYETTLQALSDKIQQNDSNYLLGEKYVVLFFLREFYFSMDFIFSFTKADAHLYGHLYPILHLNVVEYENLRNILVKFKPLVDYVNNLEKDVHGLTLLVS